MFNLTIQDMLNTSIKKHYKRIAMITDTELISYGRLDEYSSALSDNFENSRTYVLLFTDKALYIYYICALLKSNCIFMPLDSSVSPERLRTIVESLSDYCIITDKDNLDDWLVHMHHFKVPIISCEKKKKVYGLNEPIYIYCTSGSTGIPKMIIGRNVGLAHFINWEITRFNLDSENVALFASPAFDPFLRDIFVPLCTGGIIYIPGGTVKKTNSIISYLSQKHITLIHCIPSFMKRMLDANYGNFSFMHVKHVFFAGEKITAEVAEKTYAVCNKNAELVNLYGPTETTLAKLFHIIEPEDIKSKVIPIGRPITDTNVYLLDEYQKPVPYGKEGEIYISTNYASLGYLNYDSGGFLTNHLDNNKTLYRTGDTGFYDSNNNLCIVGRKDRQIKKDGIRIELDSLEVEIMKIHGISDAAVIYLAESNALVCFYVSERKYEIAVLRKHLLRLFASTVIPASFIKVDMLSRNRNGKKDYPYMEKQAKNIEGNYE